MSTYVFPLTLTIRQREDGSFIATGSQVPVLLVAKDRSRLAEKLKSVQEALDALLDGMSQADRAAFLEERGIRLVPVGQAAEEYSMPVLVSA
jgi:hypothetical protein